MEKTKQQYQSFKNMLSIIESGDIHDPRYKLLINSLEVDQVIKMMDFVREAEDKGIQMLVRSVN